MCLRRLSVSFARPYGWAAAAAALLVAFSSCSTSPSDPDERAASDLAGRMMDRNSSKVVFHKISSPEEGKDVFRIESKGKKIHISGNSSNSMAVGLNHYLKYYCDFNIGWFASDKPSIPRTLPSVESPVEILSRVPERFFLNYCTFGYTMPWWNWEEWEHFIDWMALQGINLPLAITGQESIWYKIWTEMGLSDEEVRSYFTGPSHLPWHRMLNLDKWGGPLPLSWLEGQEELQKKIVARERELGMKPVLPAFAGHVPEALSRIYPDAGIERMSDWAGFDTTMFPHFLDPMDPLFPKIQKAFLEKQTELYGTDHIYGIDLFNEMIPKSWEPEYLSRVSRQVYESLEAADPEGVWLQMTWLFYNERQYWTKDKIEPYLTSYPKDKSLLLDYYCERMEVWQTTDSYFGVPYIWCYLGNFGGNTFLAGDMEEVGKRIENTFVNGGENFVGIGSTLEGFDCNPFMYQFVFEKAWDKPQHRDLSSYSDALADSRMGGEYPDGREAWRKLLTDIYVDRSVPGHSPILNLRPSFGRSSSYHSSVRFSYHNNELLDIIRKLVSCPSSTPSYNFDVVNLTRQWLSNRFEEEFALYKEAYSKGDVALMKEKRALLEGIFDDLESLLSTQEYFLVGKWIADARSWGKDDGEKDYFETDARNLLTSWGDRGNLLTDYADRTLAGLVSTYYKGRWEMFFDAVSLSMEAGKEFSAEDEAALLERMKDFEESWWKDRPGSFASSPSGNSRSEVIRIIGKYSGE